MTAYSKKPVAIDAEQWDGTAVDAGRIIDWILEKHPDSLVPSFFETNETEHRQYPELLISTLEGPMRAAPGYFVLVGVQGETYFCKPDIFAATYDPVDETAQARAVERFFTASEHDDVVALRDRIVALGAEIDRRVPAGRNKALALTALEDVQMRGNRGIFAPEYLR